jgi:rubrerythrin
MSDTTDGYGRSQWKCKECGERPWLSDIDEADGECPECGAEVDIDG